MLLQGLCGGQITKRSSHGARSVLWGAGDSWLYGELLVCFWYEQQGVLHADKKRQAFRIARR
jgi:hypothetical protein